MKSFKKTNDKRLGTGIGPTYVPYYTAQGARSYGLSSMVYDPFEERQMHFLSKTETMFYYTVCLNPNIAHIREQYPLNMDLINRILKGIGERSSNSQYTTDFLLDLTDGTQAAVSIKFDRRDFDRNSRANTMRPKRFQKLIRRQFIEKEYWERLGVPFSIVTMDDIPVVKANNNAFLISHWDPRWLIKPEHKILFLYLVGALDLPDDYDTKPLNPRKLAENCPVDIDKAFESILEKGTRHGELPFHFSR